MDIEFHYYITHLIAAKAGFRGNDLRVLAYSSQFTDDNNRQYKIKMGRNWFYNNRISQTMDILKPQVDRLAIYPLFHFIPGDPMAVTANRADGSIRACNTTANSSYAKQIMDDCLRNSDFYQIGIAAHAYVDTWAHQNFVGYQDRFNGLLGRLNAIIPNIGHADAKHQPDWPALVWSDSRLADPSVDNKRRFIDAASNLFNKLRKHADPSCSDAALASDNQSLVTDLDQAIGDRDDANERRGIRISRYQDLAVSERFGSASIPEYDEITWFDECVDCEVRTIPQGKSQTYKSVYSFKGLYEQSDWYNFQESVKRYAELAKTVLDIPLCHARQAME